MYGPEHFNYYTYGKVSNFQTDHKPLMGLSKKQSTNPNWEQSSEGNSSIESEWFNLDSDSKTIASSSEGNFDIYLDINEDNSAPLNVSHSCIVSNWNSDEIPMRKDQGMRSEDFL